MVKHASKATVHQVAKEYASIIKGKTILTTGVSPGGLGSLFVEAIANAEPKWAILAGRNINKLQQTADDLASKHPNLKTKLLTLDLSSLASVRAAAEEVNGWSDVSEIDVLVNNAGIMATDFKLTEDGFENQFASNHLGHFLFTNLIMNKILASKTPRVVSVSSNGHRLSPIRWGDPNFSNGDLYNKWSAYGQSKTANMLFAISLAEKLGGRGLQAYSLHPGAILETSLANHLENLDSLIAADRALGDPWGWADWSTVPVSPEVGAATHVFAAFDPDLNDNNGAYLNDCRLANPFTDTVRPWATSSTEAELVFDGATETLLQADGKPVDISLRYTCRSIANETIHVPFQVNRIKFSTVHCHRDDWREIADTLQWVVLFNSQLQQSILRRLRDFVTDDMYHPSEPQDLQHLEHMPAIKTDIDRFIRSFAEEPEMLKYNLDIIRSLNLQQSGQDSSDIPFLPSMVNAINRDNCTTIVYDRAVAYILRLLAKKHPEQFAQAIDAILPDWTASHSIFEIFDLTFAPWIIPSLSKVTAMAKETGMQRDFDRFTRWHTLHRALHDPNYTGPRYKYRGKAFFSASTMAIQFMGRITEQQRLSMRSIILDEDRPAGPYSLCHPIGLTPFCKENKRLRIEHRWNLWMTLLLQGEPNSTVHNVATCIESTPEHMQWLEENLDETSFPGRDTGKDNFGEIFCQWVVRIRDVVKLGMPFESYSVVLEGDPDSNHATHASHNIMRREIAWLTLNTDCVARGLFAPPNHHDFPFVSRASKEEVAPVVNTSSYIRCNFTTDQPWDLNKLVEEHSIIRLPVPVRNRPTLPFDIDDRLFRVSTDKMNYHRLRLLLCEREMLPEETGATERNPAQNGLPQDGQETSQG
ncbi:oxidoreductase [Fusarium longipes]|uniref:Oxidoreductase n=1 Tax=Fusarium longipes TaxID=694270 RepID=A0A395TA07_9HYPO|nr:oxidoreductase [Fusarium longipes]